MQNMNWDDLKFLLAVYRTKTYSAAARHLNVDSTTVSRRLSALQHTVEADLFHRLGDATLQLTPLGETIVRHAERMERETEAIAQATGEQANKIVGTVRITSVPLVTNKLLAPALSSLFSLYPDLRVKLVPDARDLSLTRREADLAIRLARPAVGGSQVKARRIGTLEYGVFVSKDIEPDKADRLDWIALDDTLAHLPQSKWLANLCKSNHARLSGLRVMDGETALEAAASGIGKAVLPLIAGCDDARLQRVEAGKLPHLPGREIWLLSHAEQRDIKSIRIAIDWIETIDWSLKH